MTEDDVEDYWQSITVIEAQKTLVDINVHQWTNIAKKEREKMHRSLQSQAYPDSFVEKKPVSAEHLHRLLQGR